MSGVLEQVEGPEDVKKLTSAELSRLAAEIREELVERVSANGGHLASNLGVVELTIALHRVFSSPRDKIVWDVGHQSYVHKLLTGRKKEFPTLRQYGGLSGFTDRVESPHDVFGAGHACTSISAALGIALARGLEGQDFHVVAVIGDGAFGGGMAFEALNHAGHLGQKLIVVLNDNGIAISPTVGAVARLLNRIRLDFRYQQAKARIRKAVTRLPGGEPVWAFSKRLKNGLKRALVPGAFWEEMGFAYLGPVDGHNLRELETALGWARDYKGGPVLVHLLTQKGKGHPPAEADAIRYHGIAPRQKNSSPALSYSRAFGQTALRLLRENPRVVAITAAMLEGTELTSAQREFPDRVFDVGICEQHAVTMAAGLATQGYIPIVAIYSTFLQRAYDQVIHDVCLQNLPVVFAIDRAGIVGDDGKTHQGAFDLSYLSAIPNLMVAAPKDENELQHLLYTGISAGRPMAIRFPRGPGLGVPLDSQFREIPLGRGEVLRKGRDVAILAIGVTVAATLEAARNLEAQGIESLVINSRFAKPLDRELILQAAARTGHLVTVEENALDGGFGSRVMQVLADQGLSQVKVLCLGLPDQFIEHGPPEMMRSLLGLDAEGIARGVRALLAGRPLSATARRSSGPP